MRTRITVLFILFIINAFLFASIDRTHPPKPAPAPKIKISKYKRFELPNGLKVFVVENHKLPIVNISLIIDRDPIYEGENVGFLRITGELLRRGTKNRSKDQLDEEIDFIGANINTSNSSVNGSALKKHLTELLDLMADITLNSDFKQEELERIKKQYKSELAAARDVPSAIAGRVMARLLYGKNHPYGETATEESVDRVTLNVCQDYYRTFFRPNYTYMAVVGDISLKEIKPLIEKYFGNWKPGKEITYQYKNPELPETRMVAMVDRPNAVQSTIRVGHIADLKIGSPDEIPAKVTNTILGGGAFRLFYNLRETHGYTYGAYSRLNSDELIGSFIASTEVRNEVTDSSITEILHEMDRIRTEPVPDDELQKAKNYMSGSFALSLEDPYTIARFAINQERYHLPKDYYDNYLKNISATNANQVQKMAQKYIHPDRAYVLVVGNAGEIADKLAAFGPVKYYDIYGNPVDVAALKVPENVTAESVIERYIQALGGRENLEKITDITMTLSGEAPNFPIEITVTKKAPNKFRQDMKMGQMAIQTIFNGEKGFSTSPMGKQEMSPEEIQNMKITQTINMVLKLDELGIKTELSGMETINGRKAYRMIWTLPSGEKLEEYFDADTGLKLREVKTLKAPTGEISQTVDFLDYQEVNGIKFPARIRQNMGPQPMEFTITNIKLNSGVKDELFEIK